MPRILAITGPQSSGHSFARFRAAAEAHSCRVDLLECPSLEAVRQFIVGTGADAVLIFGGDGTLNRYLDILLAAQLPILTIPMGSGNDFARANGISSPADALSVFQRWLAEDWRPAETDVGSLISRDEYGNPQQGYFSCCANVGLDADAAAYANGLPNWLKSRGGYFLGGLAAILNSSPQPYTMAIDGVVQQGRLWFIAVLNTSTYGGNLRIAPHASITDRLLEVVTCDPVPRPYLFLHIPRLITGKTVREVHHLKYFSARTVSVATSEPQQVFGDGEFLGFSPIELSLVARPLRVLRSNIVYQAPPGI